MAEYFIFNVAMSTLDGNKYIFLNFPLSLSRENRMQKGVKKTFTVSLAIIKVKSSMHLEASKYEIQILLVLSQGQCKSTDLLFL